MIGKGLSAGQGLLPFLGPSEKADVCLGGEKIYKSCFVRTFLVGHQIFIRPARWKAKRLQLQVPAFAFHHSFIYSAGTVCLNIGGHCGRYCSETTYRQKKQHSGEGSWEAAQRESVEQRKSLSRNQEIKKTSPT